MANVMWILKSRINTLFTFKVCQAYCVCRANDKLQYQHRHNEMCGVPSSWLVAPHLPYLDTTMSTLLIKFKPI